VRTVNFTQKYSLLHFNGAIPYSFSDYDLYVDFIAGINSSNSGFLVYQPGFAGPTTAFQPTTGYLVVKTAGLNFSMNLPDIVVPDTIRFKRRYNIFTFPYSAPISFDRYADYIEAVLIPNANGTGFVTYQSGYASPFTTFVPGSTYLVVAYGGFDIENPDPSPTPTGTPLPTPGATPTPTATYTPTPTRTPTQTASQTPTGTPGLTPTTTSTTTQSPTPSVTIGATPSTTPTQTQTPTRTPLQTSTPTPTVTQTPSQTKTPTPTVTPTPSVTRPNTAREVTATPTPSVTNTKTPTQTPTCTPSATQPTIPKGRIDFDGGGSGDPHMQLSVSTSMEQVAKTSVYLNPCRVMKFAGYGYQIPGPITEEYGIAYSHKDIFKAQSYYYVSSGTFVEGLWQDYSNGGSIPPDVTVTYANDVSLYNELNDNSTAEYTPAWVVHDPINYFEELPGRMLRETNDYVEILCKSSTMGDYYNYRMQLFYTLSAFKPFIDEDIDELNSKILRDNSVKYYPMTAAIINEDKTIWWRAEIPKLHPNEKMVYKIGCWRSFKNETMYKPGKVAAAWDDNGPGASPNEALIFYVKNNDRWLAITTTNAYAGVPGASVVNQVYIQGSHVPENIKRVGTVNYTDTELGITFQGSYGTLRFNTTKTLEFDEIGGGLALVMMRVAVNNGAWSGGWGANVQGYDIAGEPFNITRQDLFAAARDGYGSAAWNKVTFFFNTGSNQTTFSSLTTIAVDGPCSQRNFANFDWDPLEPLPPFLPDDAGWDSGSLRAAYKVPSKINDSLQPYFLVEGPQISYINNLIMDTVSANGIMWPAQGGTGTEAI